MPCIREEILAFTQANPKLDRRIFDLGCGNGSTASELNKLSFHVQGVDPSKSGIGQAQKTFPNLDLQIGSAYEDLSARFGQFPVVISLEVVEHLYDPKTFARCLFGLVEPGGMALVSTPYHGYLKNLALALAGKMDRHLDPLWDHGHIKFWSRLTLRKLLIDAGFNVIAVRRIGRVPVLAKSMVAVARKPS